VFESTLFSPLTHCRRGEILMAFYSTGVTIVIVTGDWVSVLEGGALI
jgi:hypothetical protein